MVNTQTRWPLPLAQTAQPERWRMRRWSKEPRRISVVEGRAAASLARVLMIVSCFIYKYETTKHRSCQYFSEHLFSSLVCRTRARRPRRRKQTTQTERRRNGGWSKARSPEDLGRGGKGGGELGRG